MATVSVSYLWIALEVRGAQERAAGEAILAAGEFRQALPVYLVTTLEPVNRPRMYVCRKVKNSQARTGHQRGMGGR